MKKADSIFFKPIGGSAPLSIYFYDVGNLGIAVEAKNEIGVGWFSPNGELLAVQFDDVEEKQDHQVIKFDRYQVAATVKNGKVSFVLSDNETKKHAHKKRSSKDEEAA